MASSTPHKASAYSSALFHSATVSASPITPRTRAVVQAAAERLKHSQSTPDGLCLLSALASPSLKQLNHELSAKRYNPRSSVLFQDSAIPTASSTATVVGTATLRAPAPPAPPLLPPPCPAATSHAVRMALSLLFCCKRWFGFVYFCLFVYSLETFVVKDY